MYQCRFFTTKNCSPMGYTDFEDKNEAIEYFDTYAKNFMWAYLVKIDKKGNEKVIKNWQKPLDN